MPSTQKQFELEGELARLMPLVTPANDFSVDLKSRPDSGEHFNHPHRPSDGYSWAMVIDNAACIGCHACVIACQAENNVAVVGPEEVANHRIMQWIRIDRYEHERESPTSVGGFEPVPCMQCEKAPCEPVCPVEASVHDIEGINNQVYNRCVGTRFCQSNCPYKVRRFNWYAYNSGQAYKNLGEDPMPAEKNPDVTVRARGVMEKCTYCVQRISRARREAEKVDRPHSGGRCRHRVPAGVPDAGDPFRQPAGSRLGRQQTEERSPALHAAGRARHLAAHDLSGAAAQRQPRPSGGEFMSAGALSASRRPGRRRAREEGDALLHVDNIEAINTLITRPLLDRGDWRRWWMAIAFTGAMTALFFGSALYLFIEGIGIFGNNQTVVWGFPIANYVWWIGIGNAGTLISSLLLITHQKWRASINRFAEAMTLIAVAIAGLFPIFHMGRPVYFYWLFPYPNIQALWPQWRSALIWDFWAILSYLLFSIIFWYTGLIPDLATLRDRAASRSEKGRLRRHGARLAQHAPATGTPTRPTTSPWPRSRCRSCVRCIRSSASTSRRA